MNDGSILPPKRILWYMYILKNNWRKEVLPRKHTYMHSLYPVKRTKAHLLCTCIIWVK